MAAGWKPPQNPTAEVARSTAEEIHAKVDRHGVRPLYRNRMMVRTESTLLGFLQECELRWYRGARRPQPDAGVLFFRNSKFVIHNLLDVKANKAW